MSPARKPCNERYCPHLQPCPAHPTEPWAGSTRRQRLPPDWPQIRRRILERDPVCTKCWQQPSTEADHIVNGDDHSDANLRGICTPCHRRKSALEGVEARRTQT